MNPLFLKSVGGIAALSAAVAAGVGISHAHSSPSSDEKAPKHAFETDDNSSSKQVTEKGKKVKGDLLSGDRRWLDLDKDDVEWSFKVNKYKGKSDLKAYGFELKSSEDLNAIEESIKDMKSTCQKIWDSDFEGGLFDKAKEWCSVDKKIVWVEEKIDKKLLGDSEEDKGEWKKKLSDFRKELEGGKNELGVSGIKKEGGNDEEDVEKLKKRCYEIGYLKIGSGKSSLFRRWCMVKKVPRGS